MLPKKRALQREMQMAIRRSLLNFMAHFGTDSFMDLLIAIIECGRSRVKAAGRPFTTYRHRRELCCLKKAYSLSNASLSSFRSTPDSSGIKDRDLKMIAPAIDCFL